MTDGCGPCGDVLDGHVTQCSITCSGWRHLLQAVSAAHDPGKTESTGRWTAQATTKQLLSSGAAHDVAGAVAGAVACLPAVPPHRVTRVTPSCDALLHHCFAACEVATDVHVALKPRRRAFARPASAPSHPSSSPPRPQSRRVACRGACCARRPKVRTEPTKL